MCASVRIMPVLIINCRTLGNLGKCVADTLAAPLTVPVSVCVPLEQSPTA